MGLKQGWRKRLASVGGAVFFITFGLVGKVTAATIQYEVQNISGSTWEYTYTVSGYTFGDGEGFRIFFDYLAYGSFPLTPTSPNVDWDVLAIDPDVPLLGDGVYDAFALIGAPSLADPFIVQFTWLGPGLPGTQIFEIYDANFSTIASESGMTSPIPEPATLLLLSSGLAGIVATKRSRRKKVPR